jgi:hypothetical protein
MRAKAACLLLVAFLSAPALGALSVSTLDADAGLLLIGTVPPATYGGPNPDLTYLLGASLPLFFTDVFFLEPRLELFGTYYEWTGTNATAVPTVEERGGSFWTMGTLISLQAGVQFLVSPAVSLGGAIGLDVLLRFPIEFFNVNSDSVSGRAPALAYFFGQGRFFYPESRLYARWQFTQDIALVVNLRVMYPLFHAWDGLGQPFQDQLMGSLGAGFSVRLGAAPAAADPAATAR